MTRLLLAASSAGDADAALLSPCAVPDRHDSAPLLGAALSALGVPDGVAKLEPPKEEARGSAAAPQLPPAAPGPGPPGRPPRSADRGPVAASVLPLPMLTDPGPNRPRDVLESMVMLAVLWRPWCRPLRRWTTWPERLGAGKVSSQ